MLPSNVHGANRVTGGGYSITSNLGNVHPPCGFKPFPFRLRAAFGFCEPQTYALVQPSLPDLFDSKVSEVTPTSPTRPFCAAMTEAIYVAFRKEPVTRPLVSFRSLPPRLSARWAARLRACG